jgi:hypothetical protein
MDNYEVTDLFEVGEAGEIIQTPKDVFIDEVGGNLGPARQDLEDE